MGGEGRSPWRVVLDAMPAHAWLSASDVHARVVQAGETMRSTIVRRRLQDLVEASKVEASTDYTTTRVRGTGYRRKGGE